MKNDIKLNTIYHMDCLDGMKLIPDGIVDMICCDLPYGMTNNKWDVVIPMDKLWDEYKRVLKRDGVVVLFGNQPFTSYLVMSNLDWFRYSLVWEKNKFSDFMNAKRKPLKIHEDILIFYKNTPVYNPQFVSGEPYVRWNTQASVDKQTNYGKLKANIVNNDGKRYPTTVLKFDRVETPQHPTQKPVKLIEWLIKTYTNEGDTVLDNCMGSGTTAEACINTGRNYIGFETDDEYYNISQKRIGLIENTLY